uniref:Shadow of prion protein n=1 Tax=Canis lupus familiaris TaxID=9615 RepID=A0A8C0T1G1_CANLF
MNWTAATCWALLLAATFLCDGGAAKGGRGGARGSARGGLRGGARGAPRVRVRPAPRYGGSSLRVAAAGAAAGRGRPRAWRRGPAGGGPRAWGSATPTTARTRPRAATGRAEACTASARGPRAPDPRAARASACCWVHLLESVPVGTQGRKLPSRWALPGQPGA